MERASLASPSRPRQKNLRLRDNEAAAPENTTGGLAKYDAPKTRLMQIIIDGVLSHKLPWSLVIIGALIALVLELSGIPALPFAVGIYLPLAVSTPIFIGGMIRWLVERRTKTSAAESDSSPGVLLSSGYIAGGAIAGVIATFFDGLASQNLRRMLNIQEYLPQTWKAGFETYANEIPLIPFGILVLILLMVGLEWLFSGKERPPKKEKAPTPAAPKPTQPTTPPKPAAPSPKRMTSNDVSSVGFSPQVNKSQTTTFTFHTSPFMSFTRLALLLSFALTPVMTSFADEGMWLFKQPPRKVLKEKYGFEPTAEWLTHLQKSAVRFNSGGAGHLSRAMAWS